MRRIPIAAESQLEMLDRTPRLVDEVVAHLRDRIIEGVLSPGTRLAQVSLAAQLGVSRTPLREALRVLESEGLLRHCDNQRVEVVEIGAEDLREMYELREVIDGLAARLAARKGVSSADERRANELLDQMGTSAEPYDPVLRSRSHSQFHELIATASGNSKVQSFCPLIRTSTAALYLPMNRERGAANLLAAQPTKSYKDILDEAQVQHSEILEAIVARDPETAEAAARRHIRRTISLTPHFA
ncbi:GntR family transcriptional regulator [Nocardia fusca]|uniref:GntR family transcriptional regulator n=1 Tax=Nocardia fusca TaxID=941183 RepID=UPI0007A740CF|nr:GntR family transcriptional regulator [Nocardia fusca]